jgi:molybdopterin biosynthesis enzyme
MASKGIDLSAATWRKSSFSNGTGGDCVEVAVGLPDTGADVVVPVRDSKQSGGGPVLVFRAAAWGAFVDELRH